MVSSASRFNAQWNTEKKSSSHIRKAESEQRKMR